MPARHVAQASPEVGGEGLLSCVFSHSGLQPRQGRDTKQRGRGRPTKGHTTSESQLAVEKRLSASGGAGVEDSGATPLTLVAELHFAASRRRHHERDFWWRKE